MFIEYILIVKYFLLIKFNILYCYNMTLLNYSEVMALCWFEQHILTVP